MVYSSGTLDFGGALDQSALEDFFLTSTCVMCCFLNCPTAFGYGILNMQSVNNIQ